MSRTATIGARLLLPVLLVAGATNCSSSSTNRTTTSLDCVDRLSISRYPALASNARASVQGLTATIRLNPDGTVSSLAFDMPERFNAQAKLLTPSLEKDLRGSTFRSGCDDRAVTLVFDFRLSLGPETEGRVTFTAPNHFEVFDTIPVVQ